MVKVSWTAWRVLTKALYVYKLKGGDWRSEASIDRKGTAAAWNNNMALTGMEKNRSVFKILWSAARGSS